ncbi:uncharacterized protein [Apostichopus japonicus]|uniref:uncharacterized protein n=1 Tax=Stichopus japonicus TaxID=307972 RepID=UPI003AB6AA8D
MADFCLSCIATVRPRQEALQCDVCRKWQHRTCGNVMGRRQYLALVRSQRNFYWTCAPCKEEQRDAVQLSEAVGSVGENVDPGNSNDDSHLDVEEQPDPTPDVALELDTPIRYTFLEGGSTRGKEKIFDSLGYSYILRNINKDGSIAWRCPVRSKDIPYCPASLKQSGEIFTRSLKGHLHEAVQGSESVAKIRKEIKESALNHPKEKPSQLVRRALSTHLPEGDPRNCPGLPCMEQLLQTTRTVRRMNRPEEPKNLDFELQLEHVPQQFLVADVRVDEEARHLLFSTEQQLALLAKAKCWYADATFKVCRSPFSQLFSLHAFIQQGESIKQVPLLFAVMSRRKRKDYRKVLRAVKGALPTEPRLRRMVMDFEAAMWRGAKSIFKNVTILGCNFHWRQAVWRKVQNLGLRTAYLTDSGSQSFIKKLMALPMLPVGQIRPQFDVLAGEAASDEMKALCLYIRETWMGDGLWAPDAWCMYRRSIRTNNDVEGWHHALNKDVGAKSPFYPLLWAMFEAASFVKVQVLLVSEGKLKRAERKGYKNIQKKLSNYWDEFEEGKRSTSRLLQACAKMLGNLDV